MFSSDTSGSVVCKANWSITLTLSEVTDGGLKISFNDPDPVVDVTGDDEDFKKYLKGKYATAASNYEYCLNSLRNILQGQEKFTLPVRARTET